MSLDSSLLIFLGAGLAGGLLLGLIGVGMALVAVPLLTFALPRFGVPAEVAPLTAVATSMGVVAVSSVASAIAHQRLGNVNWWLAKVIIPFGLVGMLTGSFFAPHLSSTMLRWVFAAFLMYVSVDMWRQGRSEAPRRVEMPMSRYRLAGGFIGLAGSLIGAGGAGLLVPFLTKRGHSMPNAVATSTVVGLPVSVLGTIAYAAQPSTVPDVAMLGHVFLPAFVGISLGSVISAPVGARLSRRLPANALKRAFALALLGLTVKLIVG